MTGVVKTRLFECKLGPARGKNRVRVAKRNSDGPLEGHVTL